jgi:hypothetical protein
MPTIPITEPARVNAGNTAKWLKSLAEYPASAGWVLTYELVNADRRITFSSSPNGDDHLINVDAATTASWVAGAYQWRALASLSGEVYTVASGRMEVAPAFSTAVDARSQVRRTLEAIEATLEGRATSATAEYQIAGRSLKYIPIPELVALRDRYRRDLRAEEDAASAAAGMGSRGRIFVRFGP